jgi:hypothetical protein
VQDGCTARAYPSPPLGALETLRAAASRAMREPVDTPAVREALLELGHLIGNYNVQGFWKAAGITDGPTAGRSY